MREILKARNCKPILIAAANISRVIAANIGLAREPDFARIYDDCVQLFTALWSAPENIAYEGTEHVVQEGPVIYVGNHIKLDDPLVVAYGVWTHSQSHRHIRFMMRDDFFGDKWYLKTKLLDVDRFTEQMGAIQISRDDVKISQVRPFLKVLGEGEGFVIFPSWTRSKTGKFIELPEGVEIGNVAFFAERGAGRKGEKRKDGSSGIPVVPVVRTFNSASTRSTVRFGAPVHFSEFADTCPGDEGTDVRKLFNRSIVEIMSRLVVINAAQIASCYLLQYIERQSSSEGAGSPDAISIDREKFRSGLRSVAESLAGKPGSYVDGRMKDNFDAEAEAVEEFFVRAGIWKGSARAEGAFTLDVGKILSNPKPTNSFKKENPIRYLANQITHFPHIKPLVERTL